MKRLVVLVVILLGGGLFFYLAGQKSEIPVTPQATATTSEAAAKQVSPEPPIKQGPRIKVGSVVVPVEVALTQEEVEKGLSGRLSLDQDKGMLFIFSRPYLHSFWMPDMHFPLDMVWISAEKKVLGVTANVSNEFDPAKPKYYRPPSPAQYVLEVNAGFAARTGIKAGDTVTFTGI